MSPQLIQTILFALQEAIKHAPSLVNDLGTLFSKDTPTSADWEELRSKVQSKGYFDYVPDSQLPR